VDEVSLNKDFEALHKYDGGAVINKMQTISIYYNASLCTVGFWIPDKSGIQMVNFRKNQASDKWTTQKPGTFVESVQFY
jgi:hypothetical protein